ncbi:hypothetical protein [Microcystis aeruginosa]|uniref:hypothetical protein n=1 Tax=Microcystis aeruginosa TaxID=1126 RepID=UPI001558C0E8|nr:hypothetical protein [Microcystis aeruginosa]
MIYELPLNIHFPNTLTRSVTLGDRQWGIGKWGDGEMGKWGNGEMGKWGDGEFQLKP